MTSLASFLGSGLFFAPLIYVPFYLYIERNFNQQPIIQYLLKIITILGGLFIIIYASITSSDFMVLLPHRNGPKNYVPGSIFLMIVGAAMMALPLCSKYIKFSNTDN